VIARPEISRNEWKTAEIGALEAGTVVPFSCPEHHSRSRRSGGGFDERRTAASTSRPAGTPTGVAQGQAATTSPARAAPWPKGAWSGRRAAAPAWGAAKPPRRRRRSGFGRGAGGGAFARRGTASG